MEHDAWKNVNFSYPDKVPSMISKEERQYLFWLGQSIWSGHGAVVEIGPWLGGSTICLAAGMQASGHDARQQLLTYDNFIWRDFMANRANLPVQPGKSFLPFFLKNTRIYKEIVVPKSRALPDENIKRDALASNTRFIETEEVPIFDGVSHDFIEILFVDGAKSWRGIHHLLTVLLDTFIPNKTYFVCQDLKYWGAYWVPIMMSHLKEYIEPVHNVLNGDTVTFKLIFKIPPESLERLNNHVINLPTQTCLQDIEYLSEILAKDGDKLGSLNLLLSKVSFLSHQNKIREAVEEFHKIQNSWPTFQRTNQLERARNYLLNEKDAEISIPLNMKMASYSRKLLNVLKGIFRLRKVFRA